MRNFLLLALILLLTALPSVAQTPNWTPPRTADGHVDLQGVWANNAATPLERPDSLGDKSTFTDEEVAELLIIWRPLPPPLVAVEFLDEPIGDDPTDVDRLADRKPVDRLKEESAGAHGGVARQVDRLA